MPFLKDLSCSIELAPGRYLQEHMSSYGDGLVETFVAAPDGPHPFAIRLTSSKYIAEGMAMYVFVDGVYQCNRNRRGLESQQKHGKALDRRSLIDFRVRQNEEIQKDGTMLARPWAFEKLDIVSADGAPHTCTPQIADNVGCIQVVMLRCKGTRIPSNMGVDGTNDGRECPFQSGGSASHWNYDDRDWQDAGQYNPRKPSFSHASRAGPSIRGGAHTQSSCSIPCPAPPPGASRAGSHWTFFGQHGSVDHAATWENNKITPPGSIRGVPLPGFEYGSGPVPHRNQPESDVELFRDRKPSDISVEAPIVNQEWLQSVVKDAYDRGLKSAKSTSSHEKQTSHQPPVPPFFAPSQAPPPYPGSTQPSVLQNIGIQNQRVEPHHSGRWNNHALLGSLPNEQKDTTHYRVSGNTHSHHKGENMSPWGQPAIDMPGSWPLTADDISDTWDTDETWGLNTVEEKKGPDSHRKVLSHSGSWEKIDMPNPSPPSQNVVDRQVHGTESSWNLVQEGSANGWDSDGSGSARSWGAFSEATIANLKAPVTRSHGESAREEKKAGGHEEGHKWGSTDQISSLEGQSNNGWRTSKILEKKSSTSASQAALLMSPAKPPETPTRHRRGSGVSKTSMPPPPPYLQAFADRNQYLPQPYGPTINDKFPETWETTSVQVADTPWMKEDQTGSKHKSTRLPRRDINGEGSGPPFGKEGDIWGCKDTNEVHSNSWGNDEGNKDTSGWADSKEPATGSKEGHITMPGGWQDDMKDPHNGWTDNEAVNDGWDIENQNSKGDRWNLNSINTPSPDQHNHPQDSWVSKLFPSPANLHLNKPCHVQPQPRARTHQHLPSLDTNPKSHWTFPPPPPPSPMTSPTPKPLNDTTKTTTPAPAHKTGVYHHVSPGSGTPYTHHVSRPSYIDSFSSPYAVFRFKYRSPEFLRREFGIKVSNSDVIRAEDQGENDIKQKKDKEKDKEKEKERKKLKNVGTKNLVEEVLRLREEKDKRGGSGCGQGTSSSMIKEWIGEQREMLAVKKDKEGKEKVKMRKGDDRNKRGGEEKEKADKGAGGVWGENAWGIGGDRNEGGGGSAGWDNGGEMVPKGNW